MSKLRIIELLKQISELSNEQILEFIEKEEASILDKLYFLKNEIKEFKNNSGNKDKADIRDDISKIQDSMLSLFLIEELLTSSVDLVLPEPSPTTAIKNENKRVLAQCSTLFEYVRDEGEIIFNLEIIECTLIVLIDIFERLTHKKKLHYTCYVI